MSSDYRRSAGTHGGARRSTLAALAAGGLLLGPPGILAFVSMVSVIAADHVRPWRVYAQTAAAVFATLTLLVALAVGNPVAAFASGYLHWWTDVSLSPVAFVVACLPAVPLGVPAGALLGALFFGATESTLTDAEWHPIEKRRLQVAKSARWQHARAAHRDVAAQRALPSPPLAAWLDGDLCSWRRGRFIVVPKELAPLGLAVVGAPGAGKTETMLRLLQSILGWERRIVVFLDGKGTDGQLAVRAVGLVAGGRCLVFPSEPINGWIGDSGALFQRLYGTQDVSEPYYDSVLQLVLRLCCDALADADERNSSELLRLLSLDELARAGRNGPGVGAVDLRHERAGVLGTRIRMEALMRTVAGGLDGTASYGDQDLLFARLPWVAHADVVGLLKFVLEDFSHWCADPGRKSREGMPVTLVLDELSAVVELVPKVTQLVERGRDVGVQVIVSAQSYQGLGADDDERDQLLSALAGGVIVHRLDNPEPFCQRGGTDRKAELSQQLVETEGGDRGSLRMGHRMKVKPDDVRAAQVGEVWVISGGHFAHGLVIRADSDVAAGSAAVDASQQRGDRHRARTTTEPDVVATEVDDAPDWLDEL